MNAGLVELRVFESSGSLHVLNTDTSVLTKTLFVNYLVEVMLR